MSVSTAPLFLGAPKNHLGSLIHWQRRSSLDGHWTSLHDFSKADINPAILLGNWLLLAHLECQQLGHHGAKALLKG